MTTPELLSLYTLCVATAFHINLCTYPGKEPLAITFSVSLFWWIQVLAWVFGTYLLYWEEIE